MVNMVQAALMAIDFGRTASLSTLGVVDKSREPWDLGIYIGHTGTVSAGLQDEQDDEVPDDPALRNQLNNMMGNIGNFAPMMQHGHPNGGGQLLPGSVGLA